MAPPGRVMQRGAARHISAPHLAAQQRKQRQVSIGGSPVQRSPTWPATYVDWVYVDPQGEVFLLVCSDSV